MSGRTAFGRVTVMGGLALVASLAVTACAPVTMGAAAITDGQRITVATLDTEAGQLAAAAARYPGEVNLTQQQITQETLSWLIRFQINDQLARQHGITVSPRQQQDALASILASARLQAAASGISNVSLDLILVANGIAPNLAPELGRYQAIEDQFLANANGGTMPAASSPRAATLENQYLRAQCVAAKSLAIKVNPQFGRLDYTRYAVVPGTDTLSRPSGPATAASLSGLTPSC